MMGQCCAAGSTSCGLGRKLSKVTGMLLPGALLALMPKCPLCLAAWLTVATGFSISATGAAWVRGSIVVLWVAGIVAILWRRTLNVRRHG